MPSGHHLVYFPPQVTLSQLLPDGTDILHTPGEPFNRRLWAGGKITFPQLGAESSNLLLNGQRAVCVENINNVDVHGSEGNEKILVTIDRRFTEVHEHEDETQIRARVASNGSEVLVEKRTLFFMRDLDLEQQIERDRRKSRFVKAPTNPDISYSMRPTKALLFRFSALTFNAHLIHLDPHYAQTTEGHQNILVHGPLTVVLMLSFLSSHLSKLGLRVKDIEYRNLAPLHVDEELRICAKAKQQTSGQWGVWIEGPQAFFEGLAIHGQFIPGFRFIFAPNLIFTFPPEPWRLITPFFYIGGGLSFFFDLYFLYTYASGLERGAPRFALPGDFTVYLIFVCTVIMITAYWYLSARVFTKVALTHTWSQVNRGQIVTFYVIQIKAEYLPVCLLLLDVVSGGWPAAIMSMIGIFASHMYDFFTRLWPLFGGGRNYLKTPAFLHRLWGTRVREQRTRGLGPSAGSSSQASSGQSSARDDSIGSSWSMRGAGRRLGGN
ncbi:hypothetical protein PENOC_000200 [Penicillium occitanis (nom. inval.)]|nr:hypothetical protein PENOC_000200 [Penicillium occitanis (nom. inval.)]